MPSKTFVDRWIDSSVYDSIVKDLKGKKLTDRKTITSRTVLDNPGPTSFSFDLEYKTDSGDTKTKGLVGKVISQQIDENFKPIFLEPYEKDGLVTKKVLRVINKYLENAQCELLRYPELHYENLSVPDKELLVFEDVTSVGFELHNYETALTLEESKLVIKEYAKLHAGSILVDDDKGLLKLYPELKEDFSKLDFDTPEGKKQFKYIRESLNGMLDSNIKLLERVEGQDPVCSWMRGLKKNVLKSFLNVYENANNFNVINHGSIGENLLYFKNNNNKKEVCLCSFGGAMVGSAAVDINNFLFICLDSQMREHKKQLLQVYYDYMEEILRKGKIDPPFTLDELEAEIEEKAIAVIFGVMFSLTRYIGGNKYANDTSLYNSNRMVDYVKKQDENLNRLYRSSPLFKKRFLDIYYDLSKLVPVD